MPVSLRYPQGTGLPTLPPRVLQGTAVLPFRPSIITPHFHKMHRCSHGTSSASGYSHYELHFMSKTTFLCQDGAEYGSRVVLRAPGKLCSFSYVILVFLLFYVLDVVSITVYDRDTLLNIGSSVAQRKPDFEFSNAGGLFTDTASEPFVWAAQPRKRCRCRKRGKRAGVLVRLRRRAFQPPLPTILLANVQSLDNKFCELRARISYQRETRDCCVICLTET